MLLFSRLKPPFPLTSPGQVLTPFSWPRALAVVLAKDTAVAWDRDHLLGRRRRVASQRERRKPIWLLHSPRARSWGDWLRTGSWGQLGRKHTTQVSPPLETRADEDRAALACCGLGWARVLPVDTDCNLGGGAELGIEPAASQAC